ncbi:MAG: xanthine dehydrogenase family protein molybdopterin-binding subunit [Hyphomicrobiales bacterium]|nr:xanthine dehydrogenase family protein molybdopterin-binding subunit [Hyphomicrobiales bacterium]
MTTSKAPKAEHHTAVGSRIPPAANRRYVRGQGLYTDDHAPAGALHMAIARSPHASARIVSIDTAPAAASAGVVAILTGEDLARQGIAGLRSLIVRRGADGGNHAEPAFPLLARGRVTHVGFPVVAVVAETPAEALAAAEAVVITYAPEPAITRTRDLLAPDALKVWPHLPDNRCFVHAIGDETRVTQVIADAAHHVTVRLDISRVSANPMENRNALGEFDPRAARYTLTTGNQTPHDLRGELAAILGIAGQDLRIVSPDIGGAFGAKIAATAEHALVLLLARITERPVRWQATRTEALLSDWHARDIAFDVTLALDEKGTFLALHAEGVANLGAQLCANTLHSPVGNLGGLSGPYRTPHIFARVTGAFSHTSPTGPYRGAGRPEATYVLERIIDSAARQMGVDPSELRRRNLIAPSALPYRTGFVFTYDSGDFEANLDRALAASDWRGFARRRAAALKKGMLRGIGIANAIEIAGGPAGSPNEEFVEIRFNAEGAATILTGLHSHGQGLETVLAQVLQDELCMPLERIRTVFGDTDLVYHGKGAGGSRSAAAGSMVVCEAAHRIVAKGRQIAAHILEAGQDDVVFANGRFTIAGTDRGASLDQIARAAFDKSKLPHGCEIGLSAAVTKAPAEANFPNGCHVCEVEIDPDTGTVRIVGYWAVEDVGRVLNPLVVEGQVHGGIMQGLGQALLETIVYDPGSGQLITASFQDYAMPRANNAPFFHTQYNQVLTKANPLGVKGVGEAGTVGALPAVMNAVNDALASAGAAEIDMPATPWRVWQALMARPATQDGP